MSYSSNDFGTPKSYAGTWVATLLLIVGFVIGLLVFPPLYEKPTEDVAGSVLFVGRFHPVLLHLPVGALMVLCMMELVCLTRKGEEAMGLGALFILWIGAAGSVLAVLAGIMLSREGGYEGGNFTLHQTLALVGTAGVLLALVIRLLAMGQGNFDLLHAYRAVFFLSFGIMGLGAHFGGNMSHGSKFLTLHAPEPIKSQIVGMETWMLSFVEKPKPVKPAAVPDPAPAPLPNPPPGEVPVSEPVAQPPAKPLGGLSPAVAEKLVFHDVILPILAAKCNNCHNEDKSKGDLRLDTFEMAMQGGENGSNIVPGKPAESLTIQRIDLPEDDDDHMPPTGKDQLTAEETTLLRWWVQQGASNTLKVSEAQFPAETQVTVDGLLKGQP
ncbi:cytochrome c [Prosthecobacter fusiformis]|uniref:Cytochrome c n=1 Tax=Prosthecobacter fusiformis TaxID=48464 RepID=A0A4R7S4D8_9BACT|nr:c-type cytochrome domain-containing protein [Prosthecobacter fusiformis]TDU73211.1 cytochrome c [Prosthecobacter fusiformis]